MRELMDHRVKEKKENKGWNNLRIVRVRIVVPSGDGKKRKKTDAEDREKEEM